MDLKINTIKILLGLENDQMGMALIDGKKYVWEIILFFVGSFLDRINLIQQGQDSSILPDCQSCGVDILDARNV